MDLFLQRENNRVEARARHGSRQSAAVLYHCVRALFGAGGFIPGNRAPHTRHRNVYAPPCGVAHVVRFHAFTVTKSPGVLEYLAGESGLLTLIGLVIAAGMFAKRLVVSDKLVA